MAQPRKTLISLANTPYYHCTSRCVRRAFLCGVDSHSGQSYEHRRDWIEQRLLLLADVFAIDICAYAIMHNHYHVVLHVDSEAAASWSEREVCKRWHSLYSGTLLTQRYLKNETLTKPERDAISDTLSIWHKRLHNISWLMRNLNESIARQANQEDECKGRFWEGRFTSQALLDEAALAACMAYVDLNPIRAKLANTPEESDYTSVKIRIQAHSVQATSTDQHRAQSLLPFVGNPQQDQPKGLPFELSDYLNLVDWTGRAIRNDKRGAIAEGLPPILDRLNLNHKQWHCLTTQFEQRFKQFVGNANTLKQTTNQLGYQRSPGLAACKELFG